MGYGRRGFVLSEPVAFSAPTRIDLAGGTLDIWPVGLLVPRAATVNAAISLRAKATVAPGSRFRVVNRQRGLDLSATSPEAFFGDPFAALAGRLLDFFKPRDPVEVHFETTAPPGSGLGGSSSLAMAIAGALNEVTGAGWTIRQLVRIVMDTEVRILRTATGSQDQFAAALGGTRVHHWVSPEPRSEPLPWLEDGADPLEERLVLVYTGEAHSSADPNGSVLERIFAGEPSAVRGIEVIAEAAYGMRDALLGRDWDGVSEMLGVEWGARRALSENSHHRDHRAPERRHAAGRGPGGQGVRRRRRRNHDRHRSSGKTARGGGGRARRRRSGPGSGQRCGGAPAGAGVTEATEHAVCTLARLKAESAIAVDVGDQRIAVFWYENRVYALNETCPHRGGPLHQGRLRHGIVICPWHLWQFDLVTGCSPVNPNSRVPVYRARVENGMVLVQVP